MTRGDDDDPVAWAGQVRDRRLHSTCAGRRVDKDVSVGAVDLAQPLEAALEDAAEVGAAVVDDRPAHRLEHLGRDRRRARGEQVPLLSHCR